MLDELAHLDATAQAAIVQRGELSPRELVQAGIERLTRVNPELNAVILPALEQALLRASGKDLPNGPLRGVPFLMKDIGGPEAGRPCHAGMRFLKEAGWTEKEDSFLTRRFQAAGLVSLGRTNTPELALVPTTEPEAYGATRNPWEPRHSPGGSSGGSAAAVAAGIVPAAHASDGGGSIRIPASACGLVGLKPSRGRVSFGPALGERWNGLSAEFVVTRSVRDTALLLDIASGFILGDPYAAPASSRRYLDELTAPAGKLRIGVMRRAPRGMALHGECLAAADETARLLEGLGHHVEEAYPEALDEPMSTVTFLRIVAMNIARALESWSEKVGRPVGPGDVEPTTWHVAELGRSAPATQLLAALEYAHGFGRRLASFWERGYDLLLTPTMAEPPPLLGVITSTPEEPFRAMGAGGAYGAFTLPWNLSGQPAISLPMHMTPGGLPVGAQLVAAAGREDLLLRVAAQLEAAAPWRERQPRIHA